MKIDSNQSNITVSGSTVVPKEKPKTEKASDTVSKVNEQDAARAREKMRNWFTRAGIFISTSPNLESDVNKRVSHHQHVKAQRKMRNIERILGLALDYSLEKNSADEIDADWFFSFLDMAENIHSPAMQELWGKIFAVEVSLPGTFSIRTLQTLRQLTQKDAKIFKQAVSLSSRRKGEHGLRILFGFNQTPSVFSIFRLGQQHSINLASYGLAYPDILSLMDMGLLYSSEIESAELQPDSRYQYRCNAQTFHLTAQKRGLTLNYYKFTSTGTELAKLVQGKVKSEYLDDLKQLLMGVFEVT